MRHLLWLALFASSAPAQTAGDAADLFQKLRSSEAATTSWRAEIVEVSEMEFRGVNHRGRIRVSIAADAPLKMRRRNTGDDRTWMACDGSESFYSTGDRTYSRGEASVNPACNYTLSWHHPLADNPDSVAIVGRDSVKLDTGDRPCTLLRVEWRRDDVRSLHTLCVDDEWTVALRDVSEAEKQNVGARFRDTVTFLSFERNPQWPPDAFRFTPPPGAVEANGFR